MFASSNCPVRDIRVDFHDGGGGGGGGGGTQSCTQTTQRNNLSSISPIHRVLPKLVKSLVVS